MLRSSHSNWSLCKTSAGTSDFVSALSAAGWRLAFEVHKTQDLYMVKSCGMGILFISVEATVCLHVLSRDTRALCPWS